MALRLCLNLNLLPIKTFVPTTLFSAWWKYYLQPLSKVNVVSMGTFLKSWLREIFALSFYFICLLNEITILWLLTRYWWTVMMTNSSFQSEEKSLKSVIHTLKETKRKKKKQNPITIKKKISFMALNICSRAAR